jgi:hypothetical protein
MEHIVKVERTGCISVFKTDGLAIEYMTALIKQGIAYSYHFGI